MSQTKGGLGRGLAAILPSQGGGAINVETNEPGARAQILREVGIDEIRPNPRQPRAAMDDLQLSELASSIRQVGLLQPVVVREAAGGYELIAGERRWRASKLAGLVSIPAIIRHAGDDQMLRDALIENVQRVDLNPLEEAAALRQLVDDFGATHEEIAERVGKSRAAVTNALRLLSLAPEVQQRLATGTISAAAARAIAALEGHAAQARAVARAVADGLSVRQVEELVRSMAGSGEAGLGARATATRQSTRSQRPAGILEAEMLLSDILATRVSVEHGRARGRIVIEYADFEDLDRIVRTVTERA